MRKYIYESTLNEVEYFQKFDYKNKNDFGEAKIK